MNFKHERTLGDGMDNFLLNLTENVIKQNNLNLNIHLSLKPTFLPIYPKTKIITTIPKYCAKEKKPQMFFKKFKEPKFIPYEPYKAAVEPMVSINLVNVQSSKNNIELQELVGQITECRISELKKNFKNDINPKCNYWDQEKLAYETDIRNLRETNSHLENQLKFQAQVNSELKTLLVAAVGEDLESRVQHLTEDKLQLARALLKSANHLTSHQEQTEWLSGQCEVWRSKFLASSLMVEELARWKSALTSRINDLQETIKNLLEERKMVQKKSIKSYNLLQKLNKKLNINDNLPLKYCNIVELSNGNFNLIENISQNLSVEMENDKISEQLLNLPQFTLSETYAMKLLQNPVTISAKQDILCNALMGAAMSVSGNQLYLQHPSSCCPHCKGEIVNI